MIPITKPFLPSKEDFDELVAGAWRRNCLINDAPLASKLKLNLKNYLDHNHWQFVTTNSRKKK